MRNIATELGIAHFTVGGELKRNTGKRQANEATVINKPTILHSKDMLLRINR